jgi:hypothetical protein
VESLLPRFAQGGWIHILILGGALVLGLLTNEVGADKRIDILAFPLLGVVIWNLAVYAALLVSFVRGGWSRGQPTAAGAGTTKDQGDDGPSERVRPETKADLPAAAAVMEWSGSLFHKRGKALLQETAGNRRTSEELPGAIVQRFTSDWARFGAPLHRARSQRLLHFGAALVALGTVGGCICEAWFWNTKRDGKAPS